MYLYDQRILGIFIFTLLGLLVIVKRTASGSVLDKPKGPLLIQLVNIFNLLFLLLVIPLTALLLITRHHSILEAVSISIVVPWIIAILEGTGLGLVVTGFSLMSWALISLGGNYQLGGIPPRPADRMVTTGPYRWIRHPMYAAALYISLGLALLFRCWVFLGVFGIYLTLILLLISTEEKELTNAYGGQYKTLREKTKALIPFIF